MFKRKPKVLTPEQMEEIRTKDFFDCILPGTIKFLSDHYIVGDSYRCVWAIREYPPSTEEQAILSQLADRNGVTLRIYHRLVEAMELSGHPFYIGVQYHPEFKSRPQRPHPLFSSFLEAAVAYRSNNLEKEEAL